MPATLTLLAVNLLPCQINSHTQRETSCDLTGKPVGERLLSAKLATGRSPRPLPHQHWMRMTYLLPFLPNLRTDVERHPHHAHRNVLSPFEMIPCKTRSHLHALLCIAMLSNRERLWPLHSGL